MDTIAWKFCGILRYKMLIKKFDYFTIFHQNLRMNEHLKTTFVKLFLYERQVD